MSLTLRGALAALLAAGALQTLAAAPAKADAAPAKIAACDFPLSEPIYQKWTGAGGQAGRMGCPSEKEIPISKTPTGATGVQANFSGGASILWHASGDHAGQTYIVQGCFYRLYAQYGGASGWLGLPVDDTVNNPDGQTQAFEGGTLILWFDAVRGDYFTSAQGLGAESSPDRYQQVRIEGYVLVQRPAGAVPLRAYWNEARGDHLTVGTVEGERAAAASGYDFAGGQGYVFPSPQPGTRALKLYWSIERQDFLLASAPETEADAKAAGYEFVRIEGYVPTDPKP